MSLVDLAAPVQEAFSGRFLIVSYLPSFAATVFVVTIVWAGAPGGALHLDDAWHTAANLGAGELVLIALGVLVLAVLTWPLQLALVRVLEGGWPAWLGSGVARRGQQRRRARLAAGAIPTAPAGNAPPPAEVQRAAVVDARLRSRFPAEQLVRATALGNVLAAMESTAGRRYGLDPVVAWPRLYPLLRAEVRAVVDDQRTALDTAARLAVTFAAVAAVSVVLLASSGVWIVLAVIPAAIAAAGYRGAIHAAVSYAQGVHTAFDLQRFDLLRALHLPLPSDHEAEVAVNTALCANWRQNVPFAPAYQHPPAP